MNQIYGINANTYSALIEQENKNVKETANNNYTVNNLALFTQEKDIAAFKEFRLFMSLFKIRKTKDGMYKYKLGNKEYVYFNKMSNELNLSDSDKRILVSNDRYNTCYHSSIKIAPFIQNSKILFGKAKVGNHEYLHAVINYFDEKRKMDVIVDWTLNLYMKKEDYIKTLNFNVINEVDSINAIHLCELFKTLEISMPITMCLAFNEEILDDMYTRVLNKMK